MQTEAWFVLGTLLIARRYDAPEYARQLLCGVWVSVSVSVSVSVTELLCG